MENETLRMAKEAWDNGYANIIKAIKTYQSKHRGMTPTDQMISNEVGLPPHQVGYCIRQLEREGKLSVASLWPRHIIFPKGKEVIIEAAAPRNETNIHRISRFGVSCTKQPEEVMENENANNNARPAKKTAKRRSLYETAKEVAVALEGLEKSGQRGGAKILAKIVRGVSHTGNMSKVIEYMAEEEWVHHRKHKINDVKLTDKGKRLLLNRNIPVSRAEAGSMSWDGLSPQQRSERARRAAQARWEKETAGNKPAVPTPQAPPTYEEPTTGSGEENVATMKVEVRLDAILPSIDTVDLVLEVQRRGFTVARRG